MPIPDTPNNIGLHKVKGRADITVMTAPDGGTCYRIEPQAIWIVKEADDAHAFWSKDEAAQYACSLAADGLEYTIIPATARFPLHGILERVYCSDIMNENCDSTAVGDSKVGA